MTDHPEEQPVGVEEQTDEVSLKEQSTALLNRLTETFPAAFFPFTARQVKPLKIGIHKDLEPTLKEWGYPPAALKIALSRYTRARRYQVALLKEAQRVDLNGQEAGEVSDENRQIAQTRIDELNEKRKQQQAAIKAVKAASADTGNRPGAGNAARPWPRNEPRKPQRGRKNRDRRAAKPESVATPSGEAGAPPPAETPAANAPPPRPAKSRPPRNKKPSGPREPSAEKLAALAAKFNTRD